MNTPYTSFVGENVLDVTSLPSHRKGDELKREIVNAVKDTQGVVLAPLPNVLVLRRDQFDDLQSDPDLIGMYQSKDFLYMTPLNVMEVRVRGEK